MYTLYLANSDGTGSIKFPIPLEELPSISKGATTETFTTWNGREYTFITGQKPRELSVETWIPKEGTNYNFQLVKNVYASSYTNFIHLALEQKKPITVIISDSRGISFLNGTFLITEFTESKNRYGDTIINLSFKEWFRYDI